MRIFAPILLLFLSVFSPLLSSPLPAQAANCEFVLGFAALDSLIPNVVGVCAVNEHHNPINGDGLQETIMPNGAQGLLVWRKADNWTAFTDGYHTWINGPRGLQERLNTQCFSWETCSQSSGSSTSGATPTPTPSTTSTTNGLSVAFTTITGASPGGTATVSVQTSPNTLCSIDYFGPHSADRWEDGALAPKQSDANGNVSWSWVISALTPTGTGTVDVSCGGTKVTGNVPIGTPTTTVTFSTVTGAAPSGTATVTIQTAPRALCTIDYSGPQGHDRFADGALHAKQADWNGVVTWSWEINPVTPAGSGTVSVSCDGVSASSPITIS
jgi:hypothetical protein